MLPVGSVHLIRSLRITISIHTFQLITVKGHVHERHPQAVTNIRLDQDL